MQRTCNVDWKLCMNSCIRGEVVTELFEAIQMPQNQEYWQMLGQPAVSTDESHEFVLYGGIAWQTSAPEGQMMYVWRNLKLLDDQRHMRVAFWWETHQEPRLH